MNLSPSFGWHFDGCTENRLRGWVSIGRAAPYVRAKIDGKIVAEGYADVFRADLEAAGRARAGACAFDLPAAIDSSDGKLLEVFVGRRADIPFVAMALPAGAPVLLPRMSLPLAFVLKPLIRPILRGLATSTSLQRPSFDTDTLSVHAVVDGAFEGVLRRRPDRESHDFYADNLRKNSDVRALVVALLASPEFDAASSQTSTVRLLALSAAEASEKLMESRGFRLGLPPIDTEGAKAAELVGATSQLLSTTRLLLDCSVAGRDRSVGS